MERKKIYGGNNWTSTSVLSIQEEFFIVVNFVADKIGLHSLGCIFDLFNRRFHGWEFHQGKNWCWETFIILIEGVYFLVVFEEAEEFYTSNTIDKKCNEENKEKISGFRQDGEDCFEDFFGEGKLIKNYIKWINTFKVARKL